MSRAAVVVNTTKIGDPGQFRATVHEAMRQRGWDEPLWLETSPDDPGQGQARSAVAAGADLILACGGDGTVTACAEGVADSGVPLGILPMGTGNLLARNVGLPADLEDALAVALSGGEQKLDTGTANGQTFVVMAGLGLDAQMLSDTSEPVKARLGWAAYALSALRHLNDRPIRLTLAVDDERPVRLRASTVIVGNVGWLRGGIPLLPDARPDDGLLDAVVLTARGWPAWIVLAARLMLRREPSDQVRRYQFRELRLRLGKPRQWELDGEVMPTARELVITAQPGRLRLRMPRERE